MGLENRHDEGSVLMRFRDAVRGPWRLCGTLGCSFLGTLEAVLGHAEAGRAPLLHEKFMRQFAPCFQASVPPCGRKLRGILGG